MPAKWRRRLAGRPKSFRDSQPAGPARSGPSAQNSLPCRPASLPLPSALIRKANSACSFTAPVLTSLAVHSVSLHTRVLYSLLYVLLSLNSLSEKKNRQNNVCSMKSTIGGYLSLVNSHSPKTNQTFSFSDNEYGGSADNSDDDENDNSVIKRKSKTVFVKPRACPDGSKSLLQFSSSPKMTICFLYLNICHILYCIRSCYGQLSSNDN